MAAKRLRMTGARLPCEPGWTPLRPTPWLRRARSWRCPIWRAPRSSQPSPRAPATASPARACRRRSCRSWWPRCGAPREGATPRGLAIVVEDDDAARSLIDEASTFLPGAPAAYLPSRGALYGSGIDPAPHLVGERHRALDALAAGGLVAVSADALLERVPGPATRPRPVTLELGSDPGLEAVVEQLAAAGYTRVDTVEERGEVSVRGGLVDVFPTTGREPLRIEFFGDEIERLSAFSVFTQRSIRDLDEAIVYPAGEPEDVEHAWGADEDEAPPMPARAGLAAARADRRRVRARVEPRAGGRRGARGLGRAGRADPRRRAAGRRLPAAGRRRAAAGGRGRARGDAARPAVLVRGAAAGAGGVRDRRGGERAARADPRRIPGAGVLPAPGRGRAHPPGAEPGRGRAGAPRRGGAAGAGDRLRRRRAAPRPGRARAAARRAARRAPVPPPLGAPGTGAGPGAGRLRRSAAGRLRRPRGSRRRPVPPVRHQGGGGRRPRLPAPRVPRRRPPVRPARAAGQGQPLHRLRRLGAGAVEARRQVVAEPAHAGPHRRPRAGRRAAGPLRAPAEPGAAGVPAGRRVGGAARGDVPLRGDERPAAGDRRGDRGHGERPADGPAGVRRRRLRQDRGRRAGRR